MRSFMRPRFKTVLQSELAECGLACVAMISGSFGRATSLIELRNRFLVSSKGMSLGSIAKITKSLGIPTIATRFDENTVDSLKLPAILHWDRKHFVVLEAIKRDRFIVHNPAIGVQRLTREQFSSKQAGAALQFCEVEDLPAISVDRAGANTKLGLRGIMSFSAKLIALALVCQALAMVPPMITQRIVDGAVRMHDLDILQTMCLSMLLISVAITISQAAQSVFGTIAGNTLLLDNQNHLMRHLVSLPLPWFEKRHTGDIVSRFNSSNQIQTQMARFVCTGSRLG